MRHFAIALLLLFPLSARAAVFCDIPEFTKPLIEMLRNDEFEKLEGQLTHLGLLKENTPAGERKLTRALLELSEVVQREMPLRSKLGKWSRAIPRSHYPYTIRGRVWHREGIRLRGDGRQPLMHEGLRHGAMLILGKAREQLEKAHELRPAAVDPLVFLLAVRVADDSPMEVRQKVFESILERDPTHLVAHALMLEANMARWGGSHAAMLRFARETVAKHPENPEFNRLMVGAHLEMARVWGDNGSYYADSEIWGEVQRAYEAIASGGERSSLWAYNWLASLAVEAGRPASAKRAFEQVGDAWDACAWHSSYDQFERARIWAVRHAADEIDAAQPAELAL